MNLLLVILTVFAAFAISVFFTYRFCHPGSAAYILDHPNDRSLHDRPVPRGGGLAIFIAIAACSTVYVWFHPAPELGGIALGTFVIAAISLVDDRYSVPPLYRFLAHAAAAAIAVYSGFILERVDFPGAGYDLPEAAGTLISLLFIVWMINLYNFMDGMDGFAGGMALFGFGAFAVAGWMAGNEFFFTINLIVSAAAAGFLLFNFPPARIFMGDTGSSTLGFLAALMALWGVKADIFPFWAAILIFSPFIVDATVTLLRRLWRREKIWQAHKTHYYQQLVQAGWGHRKTVLREYVIMLCCGLSTVWALSMPGTVQAVVLIGWALFYILLILAVSRISSRSGF